MFEISRSKEKIVLKKNPYFFGLGIVALFMAGQGIWLLIGNVYGLITMEEPCTSADYFGVVFLCFWIAIVLFGSIYSFSNGGKKLTINNDGIFCEVLFKKQSIKWGNLKDWGLSYCGQTKGQGNTYYLYFSINECEIKNDSRKKLKGKMIKYYIMGEDYFEIIGKVIPFCRERTDVPPFIAEDKYHFI